MQIRRDLPAGTLGLWLFNEGARPVNIAGHPLAHIGALNSSAWGYADAGPCIVHDATGDDTLLISNPTNVLPTQGITICMGYQKRDATLRASVAFSLDVNTQSERVMTHLPFSDGTVYWDFGGDVAGTNRLSAASLTTSGYHAWGFTTGARGMEIWQDGVRRASNAANPTRSASSNSWRLGGNSASDLANYFWLFVHRDQLAPEIIRNILLNPFDALCEPRQFAIARPQLPKLWSMPARRWTSKPTSAVRLRRDLPPGTILCHLFNTMAGTGTMPELNLAEDKQWAALGIDGTSTIFGTDAFGRHIAHDATTDLTTLIGNSSDLLPTQGITICLGYQKRDATLRNSAAFGTNTAGTTFRCGAHLPFNDGVVYWDFGGATNGSTRAQVSGLTTSGYHTWGFSTGSRGMEIWQDGVLRASNSANPTRVGTSSAFALGRGGAANSDLANFYWFFMHRDQLPPSMITDILLDPYNALFEPMTRRTVFAPRVAVAAESVGLTETLKVGFFTTKKYAAIPLRRRWRREKPPVGVQIRRDLPAGAIGLWLFNEGARPVNLVGHPLAPIGALNSSTWGHGDFGPCIVHDATGDDSLLISNPTNVLPTQGITICMGYEKRDATLRASVAFSLDTNTQSERVMTHLPFSDGTVYWDFGGDVEGTNRLSAAGLTTSGYHAWGFTTGPRGMEIWQDGVRRAANAANPTRSASSNSWRLGGNSASDLANYYWLFVHRDQLAPELIRSILLDSYDAAVDPQVMPRLTHVYKPSFVFSAWWSRRRFWS